MAPGEGHGSIAQRIRPRGDRLVSEKTTDVVCKRRDGCITLRGVLLQRFRDDRVEVAAQHAAQSGRCRAAPDGVRGKRLRRLRLADHIGRSPRLDLNDRVHQRRLRLGGGAGRMLAGEEHIQQHADRVHIGGRGDHATSHLLGRRVLRRRGPCVPRQRRGVGGSRAVRRPFVVLEQFSDAEVEQLDLTGDANQHVGWLDIPVHDQVGVRVNHGLEHVEKQAKTSLDTERVFVAVTVDGLTIDVLEDQIGLAGG